MAIETNLGDNRFTIRRGTAAPDSTKLLEYEIGYATNDKNLYLGLGENEQPVLLGREIREGKTSPSSNVFNFNTEANVKKLYLHEVDILEPKVEITNKNLLMNWDFRYKVVNDTRGQSSYVNAGKTFDRWFLNNGTASLDTGGVRIIGDSSNEAQFSQYLESVTSEGTKKILPNFIFSVIISEVASGSFRIGVQFTDETFSFSDFFNSPGLYKFALSATGKAISRVVISVAAVGEIKIACAKLEMGEISTLTYDPPAEYWEEKMKCAAFALVYPDKI